MKWLFFVLVVMFPTIATATTAPPSTTSLPATTSLSSTTSPPATTTNELCEEINGMSEPQFIPNDRIDGLTLDQKQGLRNPQTPISVGPFNEAVTITLSSTSIGLGSLTITNTANLGSIKLIFIDADDIEREVTDRPGLNIPGDKNINFSPEETAAKIKVTFTAVNSTANILLSIILRACFVETTVNRQQVKNDTNVDMNNGCSDLINALYYVNEEKYKLATVTCSFFGGHVLEKAQKCIKSWYTPGMTYNWWSTKAKCEEHGWTLIQMNTGHEEINFRTILNLDEHGLFWIGGSDLEEEGKFKWLDGTGINMLDSRWQLGQPDINYKDQDCLRSSQYKNMWDDDNCGYQSSAYCCEIELLNLIQ